MYFYLKKLLTDWFKVVSWNMPGGIKEIHEKTVRVAGFFN
jgi:hypothetical protein